MKSCWIRSEGRGNSLEFRTIPLPAVRSGEVILKIRASSINRGELLPAAHGEKIGGGDGAGIVHETGDGVTDFKVGDEVFGRLSGGWAEYAVARADQLMHKPKTLSWAQAAAVGIAYLTAYEVLSPRYGDFKKGETLLLAGASSGVGVAALQIAKAMGGTVIGTSGSAEKLVRLNSLRLDHGIETRRPDFAQKVKHLTNGSGANLAINLIGGSVFEEIVRSLARKGRIGIVGYVDGVLDAKIDLAAVHSNRFQIFGISNGKLTSDERATAMKDFIRDILPMLNDGRIIPVVDRVFDFDDLPKAKSFVESGAHLGKVVIRFSH